MYDIYVSLYARKILERRCTLAQGLFYSEFLLSQYENEIWRFLEEIGVTYSGSMDENGHHISENYRMSGIEWDPNDSSIELMDCVEGFTMTDEQEKLIRGLGFNLIFVNYEKGPHLYSNHTASKDAAPIIKD